MIHTAWGPFLFDTSAESWFARKGGEIAARWFAEYLTRHRVHISAVTVMERIRGYALLRARVAAERRTEIDAMRQSYLAQLGEVWAVDAGVAVAAGELIALLPEPASPPRRAHRQAESWQERLVRWRFDCTIAATALVSGMPLLHNNAEDFEPIAAAIASNPGHFPEMGPLHTIRCSLIA